MYTIHFDSTGSPREMASTSKAHPSNIKREVFACLSAGPLLWSCSGLDAQIRHIISNSPHAASWLWFVLQPFA